LDLFFKIEQEGFHKILSKFKLKESERVKAKWNDEVSTGDFWVIPLVRKRWNLLSTGDEKVEYEDYFVAKYLTSKQDLKLLSVGCGTGSRERKFAQKNVFKEITGIDVAKNAVEKAKKLSLERGFNHVHYICGDFTKQSFDKEYFDVILFSSSLHHFDRIHEFLSSRVLPLLKKDGF
jgi:ubiquinone/menaquinone biosynthesis C-methylase UbiE